MDICEALGVETGPGRFGEAEEGRGVWVWPLLSFHHQSFDTEPEVQGWEVPAAADVMLDYRECVWPKPLSMLDDSVAIAVDQLNDSALGSMPAAEREAFERRDPAREPPATPRSADTAPYTPAAAYYPRPRVATTRSHIAARAYPSAAAPANAAHGKSTRRADARRSHTAPQTPRPGAKGTAKGRPA